MDTVFDLRAVMIFDPFNHAGVYTVDKPCWVTNGKGGVQRKLAVDISLGPNTTWDSPIQVGYEDLLRETDIQKMIATVLLAAAGRSKSADLWKLKEKAKPNGFLVTSPVITKGILPSSPKRFSARRDTIAPPKKWANLAKDFPRVCISDWIPFGTVLATGEQEFTGVVSCHGFWGIPIGAFVYEGSVDKYELKG